MSSNGTAKNHEWESNPRWDGVIRPYTYNDVERLRGTVRIEYTLARLGAEKLWDLLHSRPYVPALGAMTGNQAMQQVKAGLEAIYVSGWQVAADANDAAQVYPDQSLYPADSVPNMCRRINQALMRADQIHKSEGKNGMYWFAPIVADAEAGFGGNLNAFELMKAMIEGGAACVHFEDQLSSAKKCGHLGGKVLVPTQEAIQKLVAARLAADVMGVPTLIMARTDADSAHLLTSDIDPRDHRFLTGERTSEGFFKIRGGMESAIARGIAYAPLCGHHLVRDFASRPGGSAPICPMLCTRNIRTSCSLTTALLRSTGERTSTTQTIAKFQKELGAMGYKFQFITLAGFHALNLSMFELARGYRDHGMTAYSRLQDQEFDSERDNGYEAVKHQRFVGTGYFDQVTQVIAGGASSVTALEGSTEQEQFTVPIDLGARGGIEDGRTCSMKIHWRIGFARDGQERSPSP